VGINAGRFVSPFSSDVRNISVEHADNRGKALGLYCFCAELFSLFTLTEKEMNGWSEREGISGNFQFDIFTRSPATVMSGNVELGGWWFRLHSGTLVILRPNDLQKSSKAHTQYPYCLGACCSRAGF
jgi:hypothetical protein